MDVERLRELGVYDPAHPDAADHLALLEHLVAAGATEAELVEAARNKTAGELAVDLALRPPGPVVSFEEAAAAAGLSVDDAARLWRAFGFPDPRSSPPRVPTDMVDALSLMAAVWRDLLGRDAALALARVMGGSTARIAQAMVDAFRVEFELPQLQSGTPYSEVVKGYAAVAGSMAPAAFEALGAVLRRHMLQVAAGAWSHDEDRATTRRELVVGFADLVGYTALSRTLTARELARLVDRFEDAVSDVVSTGGGRVVKLIGDGAMFVGEDQAGGLAMGLGLVDRVAADGGLPPVRVALARGEVVARHGDYFGDVVNLAARLVAVAAPSTLVVAESLASAAREAGLAVEALPASSLKGVPDPGTVYRVRVR